MPVMIGGSLHVSILISVQTKRLNRTPGNASQTLSLVNILNKDRSLFVIQFHTVRNSRRSLCLTYGNRTDIALTLYLTQTSHVIEDVHQIDTP